MSENKWCLLCHHHTLVEFSALLELESVTSDCRPWLNGEKLLVCKQCGHVQKQINSFWQDEVAQIYSQYALYSLSGGEEQTIFSKNNGYSQPRSSLILDVGCGNGAFLNAFGKLFPKWKLAGFEQNQLFYDKIMQIQGVEYFYSSLNEIDLDFDLMAFIHVLEHIPQPSIFLKQLYKKVKKNGIILIQVPNFLENPFDLVVKDHCSHFTTTTLKWLVENLGFEVLAIHTDWIPKEISLILRPTTVEHQIHLNNEFFVEISRLVKSNIDWLQKLVKHAREETETTDQFGIFGTAIAGSWLAGILGSKVRFFVDEDTQRIGKMYLDHPVFHMSELPNGSVVYIALPQKIAKQIYERIQPLWTQTKFVIPPQIK